MSCTHGNIWTLMKQEANWAKKVTFVEIKKLDWTLVDELVVKEMISNYNHADQYVKLKGRQINAREGVARVFGLSHKEIVPIGRESYNPIVATYLIGNEHYVPCLRYLIAKTYGKQKVVRLEALMNFFFFRQGNKFALGVLISTMLAAKKDEVN